MSVGYAALNSTLNISGEALVKFEGEIKITNVQVFSLTEGAYETYSSEFSKVNTKFYVTLLKQEATAIFDIEITNTTSDYYLITDFIQITSSNIGIGYEFLNDDIFYFEPNSVTNIQIKFYCKWMPGTMTSTVVDIDYVFEKSTFEVLDYIESTGTQYIDTLILNTKDLIFEASFLISEYTLGDGGWIFSGRTNYYHTLGVFVGRDGIFNGYGSATTSSYPNVALNAWNSLYFSRTKFLINDVNYTVNGGTLVSKDYERTILIGGATTNWDGAADQRHLIGKIKYFKITDATNNTLLRNYIPVRLLDTSEIGLYDLIENKFYANAGTGVYISS